MTTRENTAGRAKLALVHRHGGTATAVISEAVARVADDPSVKCLRFSGSARFAPDVEQHLSAVVAPLVTEILNRLGVHVEGFDLSIVNVSAASATNNLLEVIGYSADVPVFLAMLSAALELPFACDLLATGHLASPAGDVAMVEELPAKLEAAARQSIGVFVYPAVDRDDSLKTLSPDQRDRIVQAVVSAGRVMRTIPVADVAELVEKVFTPETIVLAGLRKAFFSIGVPPIGHSTPVDRAAAVLSTDGERCFWNVLQEYLFAGHSTQVHELLAARAEYQIVQGRYPDGFGGQLLTMMMSVPPPVRQLKLKCPLLTESTCIRLSQLALGKNEQDVPLLFDAVRGRLPNVRVPAPLPEDPALQKVAAGTTLDAVISRIHAMAIAKVVEEPINSARGSFVLASSVAESSEAFLETISSFYLHLQRHGGRLQGPPDGDALRAEAIDLVEKAFTRQGGFRAALAEAMIATHGGQRFVIDAMADQYRFDERRKYVNCVLKESLDPLDQRARTALMTELIGRLAAHLPRDQPLQPPEYYASHYDAVVEAYVESLDRVSRLLSTY